MNKIFFFLILSSFFIACKSKVEKVKAMQQDITESVYASGIIKAENQYQVYSNVNGIIQQFMVTEGDLVKMGTPLIAVQNETSKLNSENAKLAANYNDFDANQSKLNELKTSIDFAKNKFLTDSSLFVRQQNLWNQQVGSQVDLELKQLNFQSSKSNLQAALIRYSDLKRQLNFASQQSKKNLKIAEKQLGDFIIKSEIEGKVYSRLKEKGEMVNVQTPLAIVGSANKFKIELEIDEFDIVKIKTGQLILVSLDSYKDEVFEAMVNKINPLMNERTKTFMVEAIFTKQPPTLFPNLTVEANIVITTKKNVLTLPRNVVSDDSFVTKADGEKVAVKTGLKDYNKIEILSGISANDELIVPAK
jgi:multidrug efflux pump subunit AcrA (membrane-fusion protein)